MEEPLILGIGEFLWDMLPSGKKAGGAPVNFAYHASQHGTRAWAVSAVGNDALGNELLETAMAHGINLAVSVLDDKPTGTVEVHLRDGQPEYVICEDVAWDYIPLSTETLELARRASAVSFGTLAQRSSVSRATTRALLEASPLSALKVYDINLRQNWFSREIIVDSLKMANVLKINDEEFARVLPMLGIDDEDTCVAARRLISDYDLKMLVLTAGDKFSSVYTADDVSTIATPRVDVVDAVGAGDAFAGTFVASILRGVSIREAHLEAVRTAAYVCTQPGAWTPPYSTLTPVE